MNFGKFVLYTLAAIGAIIVFSMASLGLASLGVPLAIANPLVACLFIGLVFSLD